MDFRQSRVVAQSPAMPSGTTLGELLEEGRRRLRALPFLPPPREAALLLATLLGWSEARLRARTDEAAPFEIAAAFRAWLARREKGEPVAYLFGRRELYGREFAVDSRVLVPRPETEHLIEIALGLALPERPLIADVGTGSGAIAITLAAELPSSRVIATDLSMGALDVARGNARRLGVAHRLLFLHTDLSAGIDLGRVDLMVSNPPYVAPEAAAEMSPEVVDFEPHLALFAAEGGRAAIRRLLELARGLRPGTPVVLEIGFDQGGYVLAEAGRQGFARAEIRPDYAGLPRNALLYR